MDAAENIYVADSGNQAVRKVTSTGLVTTLAGPPVISSDGFPLAGYLDGTGMNVRFNGPRGIAVDDSGNVYVADSGNNVIRKGYPAPRILSSNPAVALRGGTTSFSLTGPTGRLIIVEASTDLVHWLPLWTNTFGFPGAFNFSETKSATSLKRFYRARLP